MQNTYKPKLSAAAQARVDQNVAMFKESMARDPGFELEARAKLSAIDWTNPIAQTGVLMGSTLAVEGIHKGYEYIRDKMSFTKDYNNMVKNNPHFKEQGYDASRMQQVFRTLHKFNPDYAADPILAGDFVGRAMEQARPAMLETVNAAVKARADMAQAKNNKGRSQILQAIPTGMHNIAVGWGNQQTAAAEQERKNQEQQRKENEDKIRESDNLGRAQRAYIGRQIRPEELKGLDPAAAQAVMNKRMSEIMPHRQAVENAHRMMADSPMLDPKYNPDIKI